MEPFVGWGIPDLFAAPQQQAPEKEEDPLTDDCEDGHTLYCHLCDEEITVMDAAVQVLGKWGQVFNGQAELYDCLDDEGDYKYTPLHFHESCWMNCWDAVHEFTADELPVLKHEGFATCDICGSTIMPWEEFSAVIFGEMYYSQCMPQDKQEPEFQPLQPPKPHCFGCMAQVDQMCEEEEEDDGEDLG